MSSRAYSSDTLRPQLAILHFIVPHPDDDCGRSRVPRPSRRSRRRRRVGRGGQQETEADLAAKEHEIAHELEPEARAMLERVVLARAERDHKVGHYQEKVDDATEELAERRRLLAAERASIEETMQHVATLQVSATPARKRVARRDGERTRATEST